MMKILMLSDVYFPRVNGVPTSIESFRGALERGYPGGSSSPPVSLSVSQCMGGITRL